MRIGHVALATLVAAIWGGSFVVVKIGLGYFPPLLLAALRFAVAATAVPFVSRPDVSWRRLICIAMVLFVGEFGFLFVGIARGMPPGLASIVIQSQAFFTLLLGAVLSGALPSPRRWTGAALGLCGLACIAFTVGLDASGVGLALTLCAAFCWAVGNILLESSGAGGMFETMIWLSLIPPVPLLVLSLIFEGPAAMLGAMRGLGAGGLAVVLYLAVPATVMAFGIWGRLIKLYSSGVVAPFSLLVPGFGILFAALFFHEPIGPMRLAGMAFVASGLAALLFPGARSADRQEEDALLVAEE